MGVPNGANSRLPCASKLCDRVPKYEFCEEGGCSGLISFAACRGIEFSVHQVLV